MSTREERIEIFEGTRDLCYSSSKLTDAISKSINEQIIYWEEDEIESTQAVFDKPFETVLSAQKTLEASKKYAQAGQRVCILNFASSVAPGGGVVTGAQAQEECICRLSTLYFALSDKNTAGRFYDYHWELIRKGEMNRRNRDDIVFTPDVFVIRDEADNEKMMPEENWYKVDVITCAAPDVRKTGDESEFSPSEEELMKVFEIRWRKILTVAAKHKAEVLILGAFGCGVFANPPELVVRAFNNVAGEFKNHFKTVEFAVYTTDKESRNYKAFADIKIDITKGTNKIVYSASNNNSDDYVSEEYAYLKPYFQRYKERDPNCKFKEYAEWAKDCYPGKYETPEADPDYDRNNEAIRGGYSYAYNLAKNGEIYITIWR